MPELKNMGFDEAAGLTLPELLARRAGETPDAVAIRTLRTTMTYAEWYARGDDLCAALSELVGDLRGARVLLWLSNEEAAGFAAGAEASLKAGAIFVPLDDRLSARDALKLITRTEPAALLIGRDVPENLGAEGLEELGLGGWTPDEDVELFLIALRDGRFVAEPRSWSAALVGSNVAVIEERAAPQDDAFIAFTSGSTGAPKGAVLSHGGVAAYSERATHFIFAAPRNLPSLREHDLIQSPIPVYTAASLVENLFPSVFAGCTLAYEGRRFDPASSERAIDTLGSTIYNAAPAHFAMICSRPRPADAQAGSLELMVTGGSTLSPALYQRVCERWPGVPMANWYGLNETGPGQTLNFGADIARAPSAAGRPVPPTEVRIVDGEGNEVAGGEEGELLMRSPGQMTAYFRDRAETAARITDGWIRTGDIAILDDAGVIHLRGRREERINRGGFKFYPVEIETELIEHATVAEAAAIAVPHSTLGQDAVAYVVPADGHVIDEEKLREFCRSRMPRNKVPSRILVTDSLPRNRYEKVIRPRLQDQYEASQSDETRS